jgi:hypothetical protein
VCDSRLSQALHLWAQGLILSVRTQQETYVIPASLRHCTCERKDGFWVWERIRRQMIDCMGRRHSFSFCCVNGCTFKSDAASKLPTYRPG